MLVKMKYRLNLFLLYIIAAFAGYAAVVSPKGKLDDWLTKISAAHPDGEFGVRSWIEVFQAFCKQPFAMFCFYVILGGVLLVILVELIVATIIFNRTFYGEKSSSVGDNLINSLVQDQPDKQHDNTSTTIYKEHHNNSGYSTWYNRYLDILAFLNQKWYIDFFMNNWVSQTVFRASEFFQTQVESNIATGIFHLSKFVELILVVLHRVFCRLIFAVVYAVTAPTTLTAVYSSYVVVLITTVAGQVYDFLSAVISNNNTPVFITLCAIAGFFLLSIAVIWASVFWCIITYLRNGVEFPPAKDPLMKYIILFHAVLGDDSVFYQPVFLICNQVWFHHDYIPGLVAKFRHYICTKRVKVGTAVCVWVVALCFVLLYYLV